MTESTAKGAWPVVLLTLLLINLGGLVFLFVNNAKAHATTRAKLEYAEKRNRILGYELTATYGGKGFAALLEHLQYWAPFLQQNKPGTTSRFFVEERMHDIIETMSFLPDVYPRIEKAYVLLGAQAPDDGTQDEVRRWLLDAAYQADASRGKDLIARTLRGTDVAVSIPLRRYAAERMLESDKRLAGEILHGLVSDAIGGPNLTGQVKKLAGRKVNSNQVYNYIDDYVASGHPDVAKTLFKMLNKLEYHQTITIQRCVEHLGKLKAGFAAARIKQLYFNPAPVPGQVPNPIFRKKCMEAVVAIQGAAAVPFLKEIDRRESDQSIRARLNEYKKEFDFSK